MESASLIDAVSCSSSAKWISSRSFGVRTTALSRDGNESPESGRWERRLRAKSSRIRHRAAFGPSRHIAPPHELGRQRGKADVAFVANGLWVHGLGTNLGRALDQCASATLSARSLLRALARRFDRNVPRGACHPRAPVAVGVAYDRFQNQKKLLRKHVRSPVDDCLFGSVAARGL